MKPNRYLYLMDEYPHFFYPSLAERLGLNEAIVLQQIHSWIQTYTKDPREYRDKHWHDGRWWIWNSYPDWHKKLPYFSESTIKRVLANLREKGIVLVGNYNQLGIDRTNWYTINYDAYDKLWSDHQVNLTPPSGQIDPMDQVNLTSPLPDLSSPDLSSDRSPDKTGLRPVPSPEPDTSSPSKKKEWTQDNVQIFELIDETDTIGQCRECDADIPFAQLKRSRAVCPSCMCPVRVTDWNGNIQFREPQKYRGNKRRVVKVTRLGDLIERCPDPLVGVFVPDSQLARLQIELETDRRSVLRAIDWAVRINIPYKRVVASALAGLSKFQADDNTHTLTQTLGEDPGVFLCDECGCEQPLGTTKCKMCGNVFEEEEKTVVLEEPKGDLPANWA